MAPASAPRIILTAAVTVLVVSSAFAVDRDVVPFSDKFPVLISIDGRSDVARIQRLNPDIDAVGRDWVRAYVDKTEVEAIEGLGYSVERIPNQALRMWRMIRDLEMLGIKDVYHDYDQVTSYLQGVLADHPSITELVSIGKSVEGRDLWFMKITDNPDIEEDEPEFKYISTMHGDEPVGTENCLKFIDLLTDNYDLPVPDEDLKRLVDEVEIWIMPMMNPDGNSAGGRYNANGVDLNRSFPDLIDDPDNSPEGREPETQAVMTFSDSMSFDLSANFHTGALVVNYPSDNRPERAPDDSLYIAVSEAYSIHNSPMWNSPSFYHGITNGYDWYEIHGGMQDWNYDYMCNKEVTIELNDVKWPPASELPQLWDDNDEAMAAYLEYCLLGVRGVVSDSVSGEPLRATVSVEGNAWDDLTDPDVGDYHRILRPGDYSLSFCCPGYVAKEVSGVTVTPDSAVVLDVELAPAPLFTVSGTVTSETLDPLEAKVGFYYHGGSLADSTTTNPADGFYSLTLSAGDYDADVRADGYVPEQHFLSIVSDTTLDFQLQPTSGTILVVSDGGGSEITDDLALIGFEVSEESAGASDPGTWKDYELLIWSSGSNTSPVGSPSYRSSLTDYVAQEGRLLIEGGELAYDALSSPGYPNFADSVLHTDQWHGDDVGALSLDPGQSAHLIATSPNSLPGTVAIDYMGWGSEDAASPAGDAYIIYGTESYPADAGVLVYDGDLGPDHGQIVYFAFDYADLADRAVARQLLENAVAYLEDDASLVADQRAVRLAPGLAGATPNPFRFHTEISFFLPSKQEVDLAVYDVRGRLIKTLVDGEEHNGIHHVVWAAENNLGRKLPPGVYFCQLNASGTTEIRKVVFLR